MTKETIINNYAIKEGYESWDGFISDQPIYRREEHYLKIIDLIQEELKKKIVSESNIEIIEHRSGYKSKAKSYSYGEYKFQVNEEAILNTEIL